MLKYFDSHSTMTLSEAISELRTAEGQADLKEAMSSGIERSLRAARRGFKSFSAAALPFKTKSPRTSVWFCGTTAKMSEMHQAVADKEHRKVLSGIGHLKLIGVWLGCLPRLAGIVVKCLRMKKQLALEELARLKDKHYSTFAAKTASGF